MKYLGIDYGSKHVGVAMSDSVGTVAMPHAVLANSSSLVHDLHQLIIQHGIEVVVVGQSVGLDGAANPIQDEIDAFAAQIKELAAVPIIQHNEQFSSRQAKWGTTKPLRINPRNANSKRAGSKQEDRIDDKAAAIILQSYLDNQ